MSDKQLDIDSAFWNFALKYHEREPFFANLVILIVVMTPLLIAFLRHLGKAADRQIDDKQHIRSMHYRMHKLKLPKGKGDKDD